MEYMAKNNLIFGCFPVFLFIIKKLNLKSIFQIIKVTKYGMVPNLPKMKPFYEFNYSINDEQRYYELK